MCVIANMLVHLISFLLSLQNATDIDGNLVQLANFAANATVVVNVASECGYTTTNYQGI